jgi:hypothetical protein
VRAPPFALSLSKRVRAPPFALSLSKRWALAAGFDKLSPNGVGNRGKGFDKLSPNGFGRRDAGFDKLSPNGGFSALMPAPRA